MKSMETDLRICFPVPLGVLSEKYESAAERDEISSSFDHNKELFDESGEYCKCFNKYN